MSHSTFLPEDYIAQKADRRTNVISLTLFCVVMTLVFAAFLVTNRKWTNVKADQEAITAEYQLVAQKIKHLEELEQQRDQMIDRAELAAALVERAPRSILLSELINRMPPRLSLLSFELDSKKIVEMSRPDPKIGQLQPQRGVTREQAAAEQPEILPPRYRSDITLIGVAPSNIEVSKFMYALNSHELFQEINLDYSEEREVDGALMRQFRIKMTIDPDADVRDIEPLVKPRDVKNPMTTDLEFGTDGAEGVVFPPVGQGGR